MAPELQILHESPLKKQPEHEAAGVCPPEGASDREPPLPQSLQLLFLAFIAEDTDSTRTLLRTMTRERKKLNEEITHDQAGSNSNGTNDNDVTVQF